MQECSVLVRLGGSLLHTVHKSPVTPAEIQTLRAIHGPDAVVDITPIRFNKRNQAEEFERLSTIYGSAPTLEGGEARGNLLARLYPGANPRLPVHLKEIGLGHLVDKVTGGPAKPKADEAAGAEILPDPADDEDD